MVTAEATAQGLWDRAQAEREAAEHALRAAPNGIARQTPFNQLLQAERRITAILHGWFAGALGFERVQRARMVFSLDVDGVLEDDTHGFSSTNLAGAAALRLLQLGQVAVLLNTARSMTEVQERVDQFSLLGGVGAFGASVWDGVFGREYYLLTDRGAAQIDELRGLLRKNPSIVVDPAYLCSVRVSKIIDGRRRPITGEEARRLLDQAGLTDLTFWVAPGHTDFVDRNPDKGKGVEQLIHELGLQALKLAAMGDSACDLPMLKASQLAFLPAATLPSYAPSRRQRLVRSRFLGAEALWETACHLVPSQALQRQVLSTASELELPQWMPISLKTMPINNRGWLPRIATALTSPISKRMN
jgi:hypothetical protein